MNDNISGYGIDNHLMGLREAAKEAGDPVPEIFTDEVYPIINRFALSTSQVSIRSDKKLRKYYEFDNYVEHDLSME